MYCYRNTYNRDALIVRCIVTPLCTINTAKFCIAVRHLLLFWAKLCKFGCVQLVHQCTDGAIPIPRFACNRGGFSTLLFADTVRTMFIILTLQITNCGLPKACAVDLGSSP